MILSSKSSLNSTPPCVDSDSVPPVVGAESPEDAVSMSPFSNFSNSKTFWTLLLLNSSVQRTSCFYRVVASNNKREITDKITL